MILYELCIEQPTKMLGNLTTWLNQAKEYAGQREFDVDILLSARLAPDQFALVRQIQTVCDTAKLTAHRLTGKDAPSDPDDETTVDQLLARIQKTVEYLKSFSAADFEGAEDKLVELRFAPGKGARGMEYFRSFAQPNLYFHITTAYAILRHNGIPLGKRAFLGSMVMEDMPG